MSENLQQAVRVDSRSNPADSLSGRIAPQIHPTDEQDDRYPGSFFRIPGVPTPGKTTWSLAK